VSEPSPLPRALAALLGVEPPAPSVARAPDPPQRVPRRTESTPDDPRARLGRRPDPLAERKEPDPRAPRPQRGDRAQTEVRRRATDAVRSAVRLTLRTPAALRSAVVVAEILGPPRAVRSYEADPQG